MNKKRIICSVLAAQLSLNFFIGDKVVSADEVLGGNPEKEITNEINTEVEEAVDSKNNEDEEINVIEENTAQDKIESDTESETNMDKVNDEQVETLNADNDEVTWGEDSDYSWLDKWDIYKGSFCIIDDIVFKMDENTNKVSVFKCLSKKQGDIKLPNNIKVNGKYYSVKAIEDRAFYNCSKLVSVIIPKGITKIGDNAFYNCTSLSNITIPESVTKIGIEAFYNCNKLSNIVIPEGVTEIGNSTFYRCMSLTSVTLPDSITRIGNYAFSYCSNLKKIYIPENVTEIETTAFGNCIGLSNITIPKSVVKIGKYAFINCSNLTSITIPDGDIDIGGDLFYRSNKVESIWTTKSQYEQATKGSLSHTKAILIESNLYNRKNYKDDLIKIKADAVTAINVNTGEETVLEQDEDGYFIHNSSTMPLGENIYKYKAVKDEEIYESPEILVDTTEKEEEEPGYAWEDNRCIIDDLIYECNSDGNNATIVGCVNEDIESIVTPDKIKVDGKYYNVKSIGDEAFKAFRKLSSITISKNIASIGENAFGYCGALVDIFVDEDNREYSEINGVLFNKNKTELVKYPEGKQESSYKISGKVTSIDKNAFLFCRKLVNFTVDENNKYYSEINGVLFNRDATRLVRYPQGKNESCYVIPDGVTSVGYSAFSDCYSLKNVIIPDSVVTLEPLSFESCQRLTKVSIPRGVLNIGEKAFYDCSRLYTVTVLNSVTDIGKDAFAYTSLRPVWTSENQFKKFKNKFKWNSLLVDWNIYEEENVIKIKADNAMAFEVLEDGSEELVFMTKDENGYFIQDLSKVKVGEKKFKYKAQIKGAIYESPVITVKGSEE